MRGHRPPSCCAAVLIALSAGLLGCAAAPAPAAPAAAAAAPAEVSPPEKHAAAEPAAADSPTERAKPKAVRAPEGYVEMTVVGVAPTGDGEAVLLVDEDKSVIVPIFIGGTEALSIDLRHRRKRYQRPLTHDLLDEVARELGGSFEKVHVDDIKGNTFVGTVFLRAGKRVVQIDARPSDAIALALGNRVPIFVAQRVIDQAGIRKSDMPDDPARPPVPHI